MGSKRSKRSRRDKRNSQRAPSAEAVTAGVVMKLEQYDSADAVSVDESDTIIDGVVLEDPVVITPPRASCIPVLCRTPGSVVGSGRSYTSIRRVSEERSPIAFKPSRIPRWAAACGTVGLRIRYQRPLLSVSVSDSSVSSDGATSSPAYRSVTVTPAEQTILSHDEDYGAPTSTSSMSSLSSVEDLANYTSEAAAVHVSLGNQNHAIKVEQEIDMAMPTMTLATITVPE
ncbi:hypothetical protein PRIPAC_74304 [Pristionchus pacificus]|uniref:Uncharacterized protein n=1 Tax=Pristionchus pacificus TaxID=54126 RepID=A0A2A6BFK5_PRIPA|nr:hypothetical protein PRIPAC_74304 [Pristionchus pacificus]|eukprot:PDM64638.1 hypothetical protein PRIPAC_52894 [Pristionchus pacificus]